MNTREQLAQEIDIASDELVEEILDFCLFVKQRQQKKAIGQPISTPSKPNGILDFLESVREIQAQVPPEEWDKLPHDASINRDRYLYGTPKKQVISNK